MQKDQRHRSHDKPKKGRRTATNTNDDRVIENGIQRSNKEHVASGPKISKSIHIKEMESFRGQVQSILHPSASSGKRRFNIGLFL